MMSIMLEENYSNSTLQRYQGTHACLTLFSETNVISFVTHLFVMTSSLPR